MEGHKITNKLKAETVAAIVKQAIYTVYTPEFRRAFRCCKKTEIDHVHHDVTCAESMYEIPSRYYRLVHCVLCTLIANFFPKKTIQSVKSTGKSWMKLLNRCKKYEYKLNEIAEQV